MHLLKLIPVKYLVKKLPEILAFIFTKVLTWLLMKYPHKSAKVKEITLELTAALSNLISITEDGKITKEEIQVQKELWEQVFE